MATQALLDQLEAARLPARASRYDVRELEALPAAVQRYFRAVLEDGQPIVTGVTVRHAGSFNVTALGSREVWVLTEFAVILDGLATHIYDIAIPLPDAAEVRSLAALKPFEDAIDALVCCWVGCEYLAGRCHPLGDETAAVWCPHA